MLKTCWLAREITLEAWKKDIVCLDDGKPVAVNRDPYGRGELIYMMHWKAMLLRRVDLLLFNSGPRANRE